MTLKNTFLKKRSISHLDAQLGIINLPFKTINFDLLIGKPIYSILKELMGFWAWEYFPTVIFLIIFLL